VRAPLAVSAVLVTMTLASCESATVPMLSLTPEDSIAPSALPPASASPTPVQASGGIDLSFISGLVDIGTIAVGESGETTLDLVNLGSSSVTDVDVVVDTGLPRGVVAVAVAAPPCDGGTITAGSRCFVTVRASASEPVVNGSILIVATGIRRGEGIRTFATVTFGATAWTLSPLDEELVDDRDEIGRSLAEGTVAGVVTEHRIWGEEEALDGWDATVYANSGAGTARWGSRKTLPGMFASIAAVEDRVFVAMESYRCDGAGLGVVRNLENGAKGAWSRMTCLTRADDLMSEWAPAIAASGRSVYVVAQRTATDAIDLWRSADDGATWVRTRLGTAGSSEYGGSPMVAADGDNVLVVWTMDDSAVARESRDGGASWSPRAVVARGPAMTLTSRGGRMLLSGGAAAPGGTLDDGPVEAWIRLWTAIGGWRSVALPPLHRRPCDGVASLGPRDVLALSCAPAGSPGGGAGASYWTWSSDAGTTWAPFEALPGLAGASATMWTPEGRPQLRLWRASDEGGGVIATRASPVVVP
jgi:hypothetical protein